MNKPVILAIDDDLNFLAALQVVLQDQYDLIQATSGEIGLQLLKKNRANTVLLDVNLPGSDGIVILGSIREMFPGLPVVMVTAEKQLAVAVDAIKRGAFDYLDKPVDRDRLLTTIRNALAVEAGERERAALIDIAKRLYPIIGDSPAMQHVREFAAKVGPSDLPVLITGETGTGKDLVARLIHYSSRRASLPFIKLNMASVPEDLLESELFGHRRGAFTGAVADREGVFRAAEGGTLFLDEIGLASRRMQGKILEAVENREFAPVGANQKIKVNIRIVTATNKDLRAEIQADRFLLDLYHRIAALAIDIPPLRERLEDIIQIAEHYLALGSAELQAPPRSFAPETRQLLLDHSWPGNGRELKGTIMAALLFSDDQVIEPEDIAIHLHRAPGKALNGDHSLYHNLRTWEREFISRALLACDYDIPKTAALIGVHRVTLYKKLRTLNLEIHNSTQEKL